MQNPNEELDYNEIAKFADDSRRHGEVLKNAFDVPQGIEASNASPDSSEDILNFYEQNKNLQLDLNAPEAEKTWGDIAKAFSERHTDYMELFSQTAGEIASLPSTLIEGMAENPNPLVWAGSTIEGTGRALRDMWGLAAQSENPTSILFGVKSAMKAMISGKPSQNWREEAQQWNDARKFLWHSTKIQNGDEVLADQVTNLSDAERERIKSFINPNVAHAMGYIGLELPALISGAFTGGATTAAALAGGARIISTAEKAGMAARIGEQMAAVSRRMGEYGQIAVGKTLQGAGRAAEVPANIMGNIIGGSIENLSGFSGVRESVIRNAAEVGAVNAGNTIGLSGVQGTVGILGSLGIRTTSELLKEYGNTILMRAQGVAEASEVSGLTIMEKVAKTSNLSPSAKLAAKFMNVTVDPIIQLSTNALKSSFKGGLEFAALGYMNDRDKGAVSGAAMGMVWSGYSGGVRHMWSNISGGFSHSINIKNFDTSFVNAVEKINPEFATVIRSIVADVDKVGSSRISSNTREAFKMSARFIGDGLKDFIVHRGDAEGLQAKLISKGLSLTDNEMAAITSARGVFHELRNSKGGLVPVLFLNDKIGFRATDVGHEIMAHTSSYGLRHRGQTAEHHIAFFGTKENGGVVPDNVIVQRAAERAIVEHISTGGRERKIAELYEQTTGKPSRINDVVTKEYTDYINNHARELYNSPAYSTQGGQIRGKEYFERELKAIRSEFDSHQKFMDSSPKQGLYDKIPEAQFMFEEMIAGVSENLFVHTNLQNITTPDAIKPLRLWAEGRRHNYLAQDMNQLEIAGISAVKSEFFDSSGRPIFQARVFENGKYVRWPEMDNFVTGYIRKAMDSDIGSVLNMSPEKQAVEAKRMGKEYLFNASKVGMTMKGTKEQNEILTKRASDAMEIMQGLDDSIKPEFVPDEHGNLSVDLTKLNPKVWDALIKSGVMDEASARYGKGIADVITRWEASGFATPNVMTATYWGDSHEIIKNGLVQRLLGNDVPITHRVFVPFEMKLTKRTTDAAGRPLKAPKAGITVTSVDYMVIHRRKMKMWSRADAQNVFSGIDHMNRTFDSYMVNMMRDPSSRVTSEQLFTAEFGPRAAEVRNMCYEIFGAVRRGDESYINAPREGHENRRGPNFPINSFKLELMADVDTTTATPFPYHHGRSYDPIRRNLSVSGFERVGQGERYRNANGYEVIKAASKFKVFNPFGTLIEIVDSMAKATRAADKNLKKMDPADRMPMANEGAINKPEPTSVETYNYKDYEQFKASHFNPNGAMKSIGGFDSNGNPIRYEPVFRQVADMMKLLVQTQVSNFGDFVTNLNDLSIFQSKDSRKGKFDAANVPVFAKSFGESLYGNGQALIGTYSRVDHINKNNGIAYGMSAIILDKTYLDSLANDSQRQSAIQAALKHHINELYEHANNPRSVVGVPVESLTDAGVIVKGDLNTAKVIKDSLNNQKPMDDAAKDALSKLQKINDRFRTQTDFDDMFDTKNTNSPFRHQITQSNLNKYIPSLKAALQPLKEFLIETEKGKFATIATQAGDLMAAPISVCYNASNFPAIKALLNKIDIYQKSVTGKEAELFARAANYMTHSLAQISGFRNLPNIHEATRTDLGGVGTSINNYYGSNSGHEVLRFIPIQAEEFSETIQNPVIAFSRKVHSGPNTPIHDAARFVSTSCDCYVIEPRDNEIGGLGLSVEERYTKKFKQQAGWKAETEEDFRLTPEGMPPLSSHYANVSDGFNDTRLTQPQVDDKIHLWTVSEELIVKDKSTENDVISAWLDHDSDKDGVKLAQRLCEIALDKNVEPAIMQAHAALGIEMSESTQHVTALINSIQITNKSFQEFNPNASPFDLKARIQRDARSRYNRAISQYWTINKASNMGDLVNSSYGHKEYVESATPEAKKAALKHVQRINNYVKNDKRGSMVKSVAGVESVRDKSRLHDLELLGLVKSHVSSTGEVLRTFEFSDAEAGINFEKNGNEMHMTPFMGTNNPKYEFSKYLKEVQSGAFRGGKEVGKPMDLKDVFKHDTLYYYFPEMAKVKVHFTDNQNAAAAVGRAVPYINIGARLFMGPEIMGTMSNGGKYLNNKESLNAEFASKNPIASIILHEVQHILQDKYRNQEVKPLMYASREMMTAYLANLLGVKGNSSMADAYQLKGVGRSYMPAITQDQMADYHKKLSPWADVKTIMASAHNDFKSFKDFVDTLKDSPVITSLAGDIHPLIRSATTMLANWATAASDRGEIKQSLAERVLRLHESSMTITSIDQAMDASIEFESLRRICSKYPSFTVENVGNSQIEALNSALGLYSSIMTIPNVDTPESTLLMVKSATSHFSRLSYIMDEHELEARETQQRAGMTDVELASNPRKNYKGRFEFGSTLELIERALNSSNVIKESDMAKVLMDVDLKLPNATSSIVLKSIGGIETKSEDNLLLAGLARASLVHYIARIGNNELKKIKRMSIEQKGWEVAEDGTLTLSNKRYMLKGDPDAANVKLSEHFGRNDIYSNSDIGEGKPDVNKTYTIQDICRIADLTVEAEEGLSIGNPVLDAITSGAFPEFVIGNELMAELAKVDNISRDAIDASGIEGIAKNMPNVRLTKNDIANIIALKHTYFREITQSTGFGKLPSKSDYDITKFSKDRVLSAMTSSSIGKNALSSALSNAAGYGGEFYKKQDSRQLTRIGSYKFLNNQLDFNPSSRPSWVSQDTWDKVIEKHKNSAFYKNMQKCFIGLNGNQMQLLLNTLNTRLEKKSLLISDVFNKAVEELQKFKGQDGYEEVAYKLLDDAMISSLNIAANAVDRESVGSVFTGQSIPYMDSVTKLMSELSVSRRGVSKIERGFGNARGDSTNYYGNGEVQPALIGSAWLGMGYDASQADAAITSWSTERQSGVSSVDETVWGVLKYETKGSNESIGSLSQNPHEEQLAAMEKSSSDIGTRQREAFDSLNNTGRSNSARAIYQTFGNISSTIETEVSYANQLIEEVKNPDIQQRRASLRNISESEAQSIIDRTNAAITGYSRHSEILDGLTKVFQSEHDRLVKISNESFVKDAVIKPRIGGIQTLGNEGRELEAMGVQALRFGNKAMVEIDSVYANLEDKTDIRYSLGFQNGVPERIKQKSYYHSLFGDIYIPTLMNGTHAWASDDLQPHAIRSIDRHEVLLDSLKSIVKEWDGEDGIHFRGSSSNSFIIGGSSIIEHGLWGHAVNTINETGINDIRAIALKIGSDELERLFGGKGPYSKPMLDSGLIGMRENGANQLMVHSSMVGIAASPILRTVIENQLLNRADDGSLKVGMPLGSSLSHYELLMDMAKRGELNVPWNELSENSKNSLKDFIKSINPELRERLTLELSSRNNCSSIATSIGAINVAEFIKRQEENPEAFQQTIKTQIVEGRGEHGLSIRNSANLSLENNLHLGVADAVMDGREHGIGNQGMTMFKESMSFALVDPAFWHGYFSGCEAHSRIKVPNIEITYPSDSLLMFNGRYVGVSRLDETNAGLLVSAKSSDTSLVRHGRTFMTDRMSDSVHGINQDGSQAGSSMGGTLKLLKSDETKRSNWDKIENVRTQFGSEYAIPAHAEPVTLEEQISKITSESYGSPLKDLKIKNDGSIGSSGIYVSGQKEGIPLIIPTPKTRISNSVRRKLMVQQIANAAEAMGTNRVGIQAARFPVSSKMTQVFTGMTAPQRYQVYEKAWQRSWNRQPLEVNKPSSSVDYHRIGVSWKRMEDGRIMVNYSPNIDIDSLYTQARQVSYNKPQIGIPYRRALGFDTATGTIIPQSVTRMAELYRAATSDSNIQEMDYIGAFSKLIHQDALVQKESGKAARLIVRDSMQGSWRHQETDTEKIFNPASMEGLAGFIESNSDLYLPSMDPFMNGGKFETSELGLMDKISKVIHENDRHFGYVTMILDKDSKPEHIQSAIALMHTVNYRIGDVIGDNWRMKSGLDTPDRRDTTSYLKEGLLEMGKNPDAKSQIQQTGLASFISSSRGGTINESQKMGVSDVKRIMQGQLVKYDPTFLPDINLISERVMSSDSGYFVPEAERKLKMNGDRIDAIRLMFPKIKELEDYAWDNSNRNNMSIVKKSGRDAGYLVGHDVVVGIDASGSPVKKRKVTPFRSESEANAYAQTINRSSTEAIIPKELIGSQFSIEPAGTSKSTTVGADIHPKMTLSLINSDRTHNTAEGFRVGNIEKLMTKQEAQDAANMLMSNDTISGDAPKRAKIMLSTGGIEDSSAYLERLVKNKMSFGTYGSAISFTSTMMRGIAYGLDSNKKYKESMTGNAWFNMLTANGTSKQEMRVMGVADLLYRLKDVEISRTELAKHVEELYPSFRRISMQQEIKPEINNPSVLPFGNNAKTQSRRLARDYRDMIQSIEEMIDSRLTSTEEPNETLILANIKDSIRQHMIDAIALTTDKAFAEKYVGNHQSVTDMLNVMCTAVGPTTGINASALALFKDAMTSSLKDLAIQHAGKAIGTEVGNISDIIQLFDSRAMQMDTNAEQAVSKSNNLTELPVWGDSVRGEPNHISYTSGAGAYSVDVPFSDVSSKEARNQIKKYIIGLKDRMEKLNFVGPEAEKLKLMIESAEAVSSVREKLASNVRNTGHWQTPEGTMQYSHLRYTEGVAFTGTSIGSDISDMTGIAFNPDSPDSAYKTTFLEELQSDTYQKSDFGIREIETVLPSDLKQAAGIKRIPELKALEAKINMGQNSKSRAINSIAKLLRTIPAIEKSVAGKSMEWRFKNAGPLLRHALISELKFAVENEMKGGLSDYNAKDVEGLIKNTGRTVRIPKSVSERIGVPEIIDELEINDSHPMKDSAYMYMGMNTDMNSNMANGTLEAIVNAYGNEMLPNACVTNRSSALSNLLPVKSIAFNELCLDEQFAAMLPKYTKHIEENNSYSGFGFDYDSLAKRVTESARGRLRNTKFENHDARMVFSHHVEDLNHMSQISGEDYIIPERTPSRDEELIYPENGATKEPQLNRVMFLTYAEGAQQRYTAKPVHYLLNSTKSRYVSMNLIDALIHEYTQLEVESEGDKDFLESKIRQKSATTEKLLKYIHSEKPSRLEIGMYFENVIRNIINDGLEPPDALDLTYIKGMTENRDGIDNGGRALPLAKSFTAKSYLGRILEEAATGVIRGYQFNKFMVELEQLSKDKEKLMKEIGLKFVGKGDEAPTYPDTIPLGEENAYRTMSMNYTVMRALQSRSEAIAIADGRHHRDRYNSEVGYKGSFINLGRDRGLVIPHAHYSSVIPYVINYAQEMGAHGDFFGRLASGEIEKIQNSFEHNGLNGTLDVHAAQAVREAFADALKFGDIQEGNIADLLAQQVANQLTPNSIHSNAGNLNTLVSNNIPSEYSAAVTAKVNKSFKNKTCCVSVPYDKTHGYAANYGTPLWNSKMYYAGQGIDAINAVSHDVFSSPIIMHSNGAFDLIDLKTGKPILEGEKDIRMLIERRAQESKYLGKVPIINAFLSQFQKAGMYCLNSHLWTARLKPFADHFLEKSIQGIPEIDNFKKDLETISKRSGNINFPKLSEKEPRLFINPTSDESGQLESLSSEQRGLVSHGFRVFEKPATKNGEFQPNGFNHIIALHSMGIRNTSTHAEIVTAMNNVTGFTAPLLVLKPKRLTQSHEIELRKIIANGIPLMSVGGFEGKKINVSRAVDAYKFVTGIKPIPRNNGNQQQ